MQINNNAICLPCLYDYKKGWGNSFNNQGNKRNNGFLSQKHQKDT